MQRISQIRRKPVPSYDLAEDIYCASHSHFYRPSTATSSSTVTSTESQSITPIRKYSSSFPVPLGLNYYELIPDPAPELEKPSQAPLSAHEKTAQLADARSVLPMQSHSASKLPITDSDDCLNSNDWRPSYPACWTSDEDKSDSESAYIQESDGLDDALNAPCPSNIDLPLLNEASTIAVVKTRSRSQTVPQQVRETYATPPILTPENKRVEYLQLAQLHPSYHDGYPPARTLPYGQERQGSIQAPLLVKQGSTLKSRQPLKATRHMSWLPRSSKKAKPPSSRRSSNTSLSFDAFWEQGGQVDTKTGRKRANTTNTFLPTSQSYCEEHLPTTPTPTTPTPAASTSSLPPDFSIDSLPTAAETAQATYLPVLDENGKSVPFGMVLSDLGSSSDRKVKTIVCFIRHFLCPLCQDYLYSIAQNVDPKDLEQAGLRLVIVGNGSWHMIKGYKRIFKLPYPIYTDPTAALYSALGMTLRTLDAGPQFSSGSKTPRSNTYVRHEKLLSGISLVLRNAVKARMPVWRYMGDKALLGGEFVFVKSPSKDIKCIWAHRMRYTTAHDEIVNVMGEAQRNADAESSYCGTTNCGSSIRTVQTIRTALTSLDCSSAGSCDTTQTPRSSEFFAPSVVSAQDQASIDESVVSIKSRSTKKTTNSEWRTRHDREVQSLFERRRWRRLIGMMGEEYDDDDISTVELPYGSYFDPENDVLDIGNDKQDGESSSSNKYVPWDLYSEGDADEIPGWYDVY